MRNFTACFLTSVEAQNSHCMAIKETVQESGRVFGWLQMVGINGLDILLDLDIFRDRENNNLSSGRLYHSGTDRAHYFLFHNMSGVLTTVPSCERMILMMYVNVQ